MTNSFIEGLLKVPEHISDFRLTNRPSACLSFLRRLLPIVVVPLVVAGICEKKALSYSRKNLYKLGKVKLEFFRRC